MWANLIVKTDIFIHALSKVPFRSIFAPVGFLFFECGKECLCDRIIERRAACGKGLLNAILLQKFTKCCGNILPAPITVKGQTLRIASFCISSTESGCDKTGTGCAGYSIPDDFAGEEVNDSTKIDPCILCITYTNRAADELSKGILSKNVFIGTIHSFLHFFLKPYFAHQDILELYFEIYGAQISERIDNKSQKESIAESNARYIEKYGKLDYDMVRNNIKVLSYNESPFSSLYYGGLSHDDLIGFSKAIFNRYPVIKKRMTSKYQFIFIDEYQDTMSDVLKIFFESVHNTKTKLFLFGDRMQQIYKNYDGSFEESFELFDTTKALTTNYRSTKSIVNILNRIYNDPAFVQNISEKMRSTDSDFDPRIIISHSIQAEIENLRKTDPDTLILYLFNKERFSDIDAINLYNAFDKMEKYSFGKAVSAVDVLTTHYEDNPDSLLKVLFCIVELLRLYKAQQYGSIIQILKGNKSVFSKDSWNIKTHNDKETVFNSIKQVFNIIESESKTIADLIRGLSNVHLLNEA